MALSLYRGTDNEQLFLRIHSRVLLYGKQVVPGDSHAFSGGLGVLSGDTFDPAQNLGMRMVTVTPIQPKGYFRQKLDDNGK